MRNNESCKRDSLVGHITIKAMQKNQLYADTQLLCFKTEDQLTEFLQTVVPHKSIRTLSKVIYVLYECFGLDHEEIEMKHIFAAAKEWQKSTESWLKKVWKRKKQHKGHQQEQYEEEEKGKDHHQHLLCNIQHQPIQTTMYLKMRYHLFLLHMNH